MGEARGCRGGAASPHSRLPFGPPLARSSCLRRGAAGDAPLSSAQIGMRAAPSRRNGGPRPSSALALNRGGRPRLTQMAATAGAKSLRARCGVPLRPPVPLLRRFAVAAAAGGPSGRLPPSHFLAVVAVGSSRPTPPPSPRRPVLLRAAKVGGACFRRPKAARAAAAARPSAPAPPPGFGPGAGLFYFRCGGFGDCAACGRRTRCAIGCGVHGFAMSPRES